MPLWNADLGGIQVCAVSCSTHHHLITFARRWQWSCALYAAIISVVQDQFDYTAVISLYHEIRVDVCFRVLDSAYFQLETAVSLLALAQRLWICEFKTLPKQILISTGRQLFEGYLECDARVWGNTCPRTRSFSPYRGEYDVTERIMSRRLYPYYNTCDVMLMPVMRYQFAILYTLLRWHSITN